MTIYRWWFLSILLLWPGLVLAQPPTLALQLLEESDPAASYSALAASRTLGTVESQRLPQGSKAFAWYRVQLLKAPQEPVLVLRNSLGARVRLLLADGSEQSQRRGTWPVEQPQFSQFNLVFDLPTVRAGESVFLGVANAPAQAILLGLYERADYLALDANSIRLLSACLGILLAFATLGLVFFAAERDHISLVFACSLLLQFVYFGFMFGEAAYWPLLGRLWPHWVEICVIAVGLSTIFLSEVYARLIDLPQRMPRLMRCIRLLYLWSGAIVLVTLLDWLTRSGTRSEWAAQASFSGNFLILIVTVLLITGMIVSAIQGQRRALIVLLATVIATSANLMRASQFGFGWVDLEWTWSLQVLGVAIASSLMSLALTQRFLGLRDERDRAQNLATHDPLTGALNRLGGMTIAHRLFDQGRQSATPLCAALLDLDHFKQVNDRFGHAIGDAALKLFAEVAQASLDGEQQLMRLGGEEFVLLLPGYDLKRALDHLNALRMEVQLRGEQIDGAPCGLTVSIGVAQARGDHASVDALLNEADKALYAAKRTGRNRAVAFSDLPSPAGANIDAQPGHA